jgi:hypothetical protein
MWQGASAGPYDKARDQQLNAQITQLGDRKCRAN